MFLIVAIQRSERNIEEKILKNDVLVYVLKNILQMIIPDMDMHGYIICSFAIIQRDD